MRMKKNETTRRLVAWSLTALVLLCTYLWARHLENTFQRADWFTGFVLLAATSMLMLLSLRKKLIVLPLGRVSYWLQIHQYAGMFALVVYFMHAGIVIQGWMELGLASLFLFTSLSGIVHWYLNRIIPLRLRSAGQDRLLADLPELRHNLAVQAYAIAIEAAGKIGCAVLSEHYGKSLISFFQRPRSLAYAVLPSGRLKRQHLEELERLDRYLSDEGRNARNQLCQLVQDKDDLDFHEAMQRRLRIWNSLHLSVIWLLWIAIGLHVILAYRFHSH